MLMRTDLEAGVLRIPIKGVTEDEGRSFWNRYYLERFHRMATRLKCFENLNRQIFSRVETNPNAEVLELGCGSGRNIPLILDAMGLDKGRGKVWAIDFNFPALELANENLGDPPNIIFKQDNIRQLSFRGEVFDAVFDIFAGTYLPLKGWELGVKEAFRVLKTGGYGYFLYWEHGKNFGKCIRGQIIRELIHNPVGLFWGLHLKLVQGLNIWDKFVEGGGVVYPTIEELLGLIKENGGRVDIVEKALMDTCIFIKAKKP